MIHLYAVLILFVVVTVSQFSVLFAQGNERMALDFGALPSNEGVSFHVRRGQRRFEEQGTQLEKPLPSQSVESSSSVHNDGKVSQGSPNPALRTKPIPPKGAAKPACYYTSIPDELRPQAASSESRSSEKEVFCPFSLETHCVQQKENGRYDPPLVFTGRNETDSGVSVVARADLQIL